MDPIHLASSYLTILSEQEVIQIAQIRVFRHDILVNVLMHEYFLVTPVHKQSRYDFEEFTLAQFARLPGGEACGTVNSE